jgi:hypothetical protein
MPIYSSEEARLVDEQALRKFLLSKGLTPRCRKWSIVRARHAHKFYVDTK